MSLSLLNRGSHYQSISMEADGEHAVQKRYLAVCLLALRDAKNDTEKFAALLMVAKVVQAQHCSAEDRQQILEAVGLPFLCRLLRTKSVPEGCSLLIFKSVAVSVLSAIIDHPSVANDQQMTLVIPHLKEILGMALMENPAEEHMELQREMVRDAHSILTTLACTPQGAQQLLNKEFPGLLVQILDGKPEEEVLVMAHTLLVLLLRQCGTQVWTDSSAVFDHYLQVLARCVSDCEDKTLFSLCELMTHMLSYAPEKSNHDTNVTALRPLLNKLSLVIRSKIGVQGRGVVVRLMNQLVVSVGLRTVLPPTCPDHRPFLLLLHLTCAEVRMAVENVTEEQVRQAASELSLHYNMLETALSFLCQLGDDDDNGDDDDDSWALPLEADMFCKAHDALLGAVHGVFYFLQQIESGTLVLPLHEPVVVASVRLVAAFTSQAFTEVKDNVVSILPLLVRMCEAEAGGTSTADKAAMKPSEDEDKTAAQRSEHSPQHLTSTTTSDSASASQRGEHSCTCISNKLTLLDIRSDDDDDDNDDRVVDISGASPTSESESSSSKKRECKTCSRSGGQDSDENLSRLSVEKKKTDILGKTKKKTKFATDTELESHTHSGSQESAGEDSRATTEMQQSCCNESSPTEATGEKKEKHAESSGAGVDDGDDRPSCAVPRTVEDLTRWVCHKTQGTSSSMPGLRVVQFLVPVLDLVCDDADSTRVFLELQGPSALVHFLQQGNPSMLTSSVQDLDTHIQVLALLMQLLTQEDSLVQSPAFTSLLTTALSTLPLIGDGRELYMYKAHWIAVGASLLQARGSQRKSCSAEQVSKFLQSSVVFVCHMPHFLLEGKMERKACAQLWRNTEDSWTLALLKLMGLRSCFPEMTGLLVKHNFLDVASVLLGSGQGDGVLKKENGAAVKAAMTILKDRRQ